MQQRVAVQKERLPVFSPAARHPCSTHILFIKKPDLNSNLCINLFKCLTGSGPPVQEHQHNTLVLLEQLVGELGQDVQEGEVGGRARRVVGTLARRHGKKDAGAVQGGDGLAVLHRVQAEGQRKPFRQLLQDIPNE